MNEDDKLIWEIVKEENVTPPGGGGGTSKTKLSEFENDVGFITADDVVDKLATDDVVDTLTSDDATKPLSARQGKVLFQSVSDGKNLVAGAITDKGVPTNPGDTFATMADNILDIQTGIDTSDATATSSDILSGKTAYNSDGKITGSMVNRTGAVTAQARSRSGTTLRFRPQPGYYDGSTSNYVQYTDPNFIAANIVSGKSIFGLSGTASTGVSSASGTAEVSSSTLPFVLRSGATVNIRYIEVKQSFGFTPYIIFLRYSSYTYTFYNRYASTAYRISADAQTSRVSIDEAKMYVIKESSPAYVNSNGFLLPAFRSGVTYNWYAIGLV